MRFLLIFVQVLLAALVFWLVSLYRRSRYGSSEARVNRSGVTTLFHDGERDGS